MAVFMAGPLMNPGAGLPACVFLGASMFDRLLAWPNPVSIRTAAGSTSASEAAARGHGCSSAWWAFGHGTSGQLNTPIHKIDLHRSSPIGETPPAESWPAAHQPREKGGKPRGWWTAAGLQRLSRKLETSISAISMVARPNRRSGLW